jgi:hypothetical protein
VEINEIQAREFQKLFRREYGEELSLEESLEQGSKLVSLVEAVYRPIKSKSQENNQTPTSN